jgi:hypothetical protein
MEVNLFQSGRDRLTGAIWQFLWHQQTGMKEVAMTLKRRIKREFRRSTPGKFFSICQKVKRGLTDNPNYPDTTWGGNIGVLQRFFEMVVSFEVAYHLASNGDRLLIRERDKLIEEMVEILEEIALLLESASVRNPDALLTTGFSVTHERRTHTRTKLPLGPPADFSVANLGDQGKAEGSASSMPGALNHEIYMNRKDPAVEEDWYHKAIFHDATSMVMEKLEPGNIFFRMRHHGAEGPGPWSPITSTTIS